MPSISQKCALSRNVKKDFVCRENYAVLKDLITEKLSERSSPIPEVSFLLSAAEAKRRRKAVTATRCHGSQ